MRDSVEVDVSVADLLARADAAPALPKLGGMARPNGVVIVSERHWAFATVAGELHVEVEHVDAGPDALAVAVRTGVWELVFASSVGENDRAAKIEQLLHGERAYRLGLGRRRRGDHQRRQSVRQSNSRRRRPNLGL